MARINLKLLPLKFLLFFLFSAIGCLPAFLTIHMYHIGLSHEEVTWINTILPLTALVGPPFVGYLADRFGHYRLITIISLLLAGVFHTSLLFVPERSSNFKPEIKMICSPEFSNFIVQSCSQSCPQIPKLYSGKFSISKCHHSCKNEVNICRGLQIESKNSSSFESSFLDKESDLENTMNPKVCFYDEFHTRCENFSYNTFIEVTSGSLIQKEISFDDESYCCNYSFEKFVTKSGRFSSLKCPSQNNCQVLCSVDEIKNDSYVLQGAQCTAASRPEVTFWVYFILRSIADMFPAILISLFDAVVLTMVAQHGGDYGRQKMFGLFAVGTSAPIVGYLMDQKIGVHGSYTYSPVFYVFDLLLAVTAVITFLLPLKVEVQRSSMLKNMANLIRTYEFNVLLLVVIILGALNGYLETFLYIYLSQNLGASNFLLGMTITVGIVPSVPFLYKSDHIVNYCGHHYLLMLAFVGYCIRFAGLSYISNPLWVIPLEILELFSINLMQVAAVTLAYKLAPKRLLATAQGLVWISHFDIGRALGTIVGGYLIQIYGMAPVFQIASVFSAICAGIYLFLYQVFHHLRKRSTGSHPLNENTKESGNTTNANNVLLQPLKDA